MEAIAGDAFAKLGLVDKESLWKTVKLAER
jgi:hypothetical protein